MPCCPRLRIAFSHGGGAGFDAEVGARLVHRNAERLLGITDDRTTA